MYLRNNKWFKHLFFKNFILFRQNWSLANLKILGSPEEKVCCFSNRAIFAETFTRSRFGVKKSLHSFYATKKKSGADSTQRRRKFTRMKMFRKSIHEKLLDPFTCFEWHTQMAFQAQLCNFFTKKTILQVVSSSMHEPLLFSRSEKFQ
jgi:hypothetical protein